MSADFADLQNGDITAFTKLYGDIHKKLYYVAYYSLAGSAEAVRVISSAARYAYDNTASCKNETELGDLLLKKTCEQIIARFREYRSSPPQYERNPSFIKAQMSRLTDAERLSVTIWSAFGYNADKISAVTGLSPDLVEKKLESGQEKLKAKL